MSDLAPQSKLTEALKKRVLELLSIGAPVCTICNVVGISRTTWYNWMKEGEDPNGRRELRDFLAAANLAKELPTVRALATIAKAKIDGDASSAWKWLERTKTEQFGRVDRVKAEVDVKANVEVDLNVQAKARQLSGKDARASLHQGFERLRAGGAVNDD